MKKTFTPSRSKNRHTTSAAADPDLPPEPGSRGIQGKLDAALRDVTPDNALCVAYLDLNPSRTVNDIYGHTAGEDILYQVKRRIETILSGHHSVSRAGAESFAILFQGVSLEQAQAIAQRILDSVRRTPCHVGTGSFRPRAVMGLAEIAKPLSALDALSVATRACRMAGQDDPNTVGAYHHDAQEIDEHLQVLALLKAMSDGLPPERLTLHMQPILSLHDPASSLNFEMLLRMRDSRGSDIPVTRLITTAEENGMMPFVDRWVFRTALEWLNQHLPNLDRTRFVCINLSGMSLDDEAFVDDFFAILDDYPHLASLLCVEITEGVALRNKENSRRIVRRIQARGVRVALDDFGAGYTSFSYLAELPADIIKIDGQFIRSMKHNAPSIAIIQAIITLARNLGMRSIAEWVEDVETLATLRELGVDYVQGNAIAEPMPPAALLAIGDITGHIADEDIRATVLRARYMC